MTEHHSEGPQEEPEAAGNQTVVNRGDNTAYDAGQRDNTQAGHQRLNGGEVLALGIIIVQETTYPYGNDGDNKDIQEHAYGIDGDNLSCQILHQQRRHNGGQQGRGAGHTHRECHIAVTEIRHDVAADTARAAAHKQNTQCQSGLQVEYLNQQVGYAGHNEELGTGTDKDVEGTARQNTEIVGGEGKSHREHDNAQDNGLCVAPYPQEEVGQEEGHYRYSDDKQRGITGKPSA